MERDDIAIKQDREDKERIRARERARMLPAQSSNDTSTKHMIDEEQERVR